MGQFLAVRSLSTSADLLMEEVADAIAGGSVVDFPICGTMGLVCDGSNLASIEEVFRMKGRDSARSLVVAASAIVRPLLMDSSRLSPVLADCPLERTFVLPTFLVVPARDWLPDVVTVQHSEIGSTVAIFWAEFYLPLARLEAALRRLRPASFLVGSSANRTGSENTNTALGYERVYLRPSASCGVLSS
jgi:hypothetical protein